MWYSPVNDIYCWTLHGGGLNSILGNCSVKSFQIGVNSACILVSLLGIRKLARIATVNIYISNTRGEPCEAGKIGNVPM